jgi:hypothetical protein
MPYSQTSIDAFTADILKDIPRFKQIAEDAKGVQDIMSEPMGLDPSTLSLCIDSDPTGQLREIVDNVSRRRLGHSEKKLIDLADGEVDTGRQQFTALAMLLNNRHPGYGTQKVEHSGNVVYQPPPGAGDVVEDGPALGKLFKLTGTDGKGDAK